MNLFRATSRKTVDSKVGSRDTAAMAEFQIADKDLTSLKGKVAVVTGMLNPPQARYLLLSTGSLRRITSAIVKTITH